MFERFTDRARKVMALANQEAQRLNHAYIDTEHILIGLLKEGTGVGPNVLKNMGVGLGKARQEVEKLVEAGLEEVRTGKLPHTSRAKRVIECAIEESRKLGHNYVGTEHLLLGLLCEPDGIAAQVLINLGLKLEDIREEVIRLLGGPLHLTPAGAPNEKQLEELLKDDPVAALLKQLIRDLEMRREEATGHADYEFAAGYNDLLTEAQALLQHLGTVLGLRRPPSG